LDILVMKRNGLSNREIGRRLGKDPRTVRRYIANPQAAMQPRQPAPRPSKLDPFRANIEAWLVEDSHYSAAWVYDRLKPMGYTGSYEIAKRLVASLKEERSRIAYLRFETEPGIQAQVDFGEFAVDLPDGRSQILYCFAMILGYSRSLYAELVERCDLTTFLDCHVRAFERFGGVPREILYDRMKNVFIRKLANQTVFNSSLTSLALHYGFKPEVAPAYAPWVKGKVERPFHFVRDGFWRGYGYTGVERANHDLWAWLETKALRVHGTTHQRVCDRFEKERPVLGSLPPSAFDTSYRLFRAVHKDCIVYFDGNRYMVPHQLVGKQMVLRVKDGTVRIFHDDRLAATYAVPQDKGQLVADPRLVEALKNDRINAQRKYTTQDRLKGRAKLTISPVIPAFAIGVETRPLSVYANLAGEAAA
jgi:transposase